MPAAVVATLETLANSRNLAAIPVLEAGLDCPQESIRLGAIRALCRHDSADAKRALLSRLHCFTEEGQQIFCQDVRKMVDVLVEACESDDRQVFENACRAALWLLEVDVAAALASQLTPDSRGALAAETLWGLAELAGAVAAGKLEDPRRRSSDRLTAKVSSAVETAMQSVREHGHAVVLHAYLRFARRDSRTLLGVLRDPTHPCFELVDMALRDDEDEICTTLAASFIGASQPPKSVVEVISSRVDPLFLAAVAARAGNLPPSELKAVKQLPPPAWLEKAHELLASLSSGAQAGLVKLAASLIASDDEAQPLLTAAMAGGELETQRVALDLLGKLTAPWADDLIYEALAAETPSIRAAAAALLRDRPAPNNLARLVSMLEDGDAEVEAVARDALRELNAKQFLASYESIDDAARVQAGRLIAKVDSQAVPIVAETIRSRASAQRLRGIHAAAAMGLVDKVWEDLQTAYKDQEPGIRAAVVEATVDAKLEAVEELLAAAEHDESPLVREAAKRTRASRGAAPTKAAP